MNGEPSKLTGSGKAASTAAAAKYNLNHQEQGQRQGHRLYLLGGGSLTVPPGTGPFSSFTSPRGLGGERLPVLAPNVDFLAVADQ